MVKVDGYESMTADVSKQEAVIRYDPQRTSPDELAEHITEGTPFEASVLH